MALWRFGIGLLGGRWMFVVGLVAIACGYAALTYVSHYPRMRVSFTQSWVEQATLLVTVAAIAISFAVAMVPNAWRTRAVLRLAPGAGLITSALAWRLALIALVAVVPAVILRALLSMKFGPAIDATISLADVGLKDYGLAALYLGHVVVLMWITFGPLKVPTQFVALPILYGAMMWSSRSFFWLPLATCAVLVAARWFWPLLESRVGANPFWSRRAAERGQQRARLWTGLLQRRAARASGGNAATLRIAALLATQSSVFVTMASVLALVVYTVVKPGFMDASGVMWLMAYVVVALAAKPSPIPLARVMLLPLGADRARMGQIIGSVWMRDCWMRLALGISIGFVVRVLCWWLEWPAFLRLPFFSVGGTMAQLIWIPIAHAVGLFGIALSAVLLASASPRLLQDSGFLSTISIVEVFCFAVVGITFKWALNELIPATGARDTAHITFAVVNGAMLPACAWCVNRGLRYQWATANLSAISAAMQAWSARVQKAFSMQ